MKLPSEPACALASLASFPLALSVVAAAERRAGYQRTISCGVELTAIASGDSHETQR
jgi:hypothetical protein